MPTLTDKQQTFVNEYLVDLNATQAALRAGYSEKTSYSIGQENLKKPEIAEAIEKGMDKRSKRTDITADKVLEAIAAIGFSTSEDIKVNERLKGLELLGKHLVLFSDKVVHEGEMTQYLKVSVVADKEMDDELEKAY